MPLPPLPDPHDRRQRLTGAAKAVVYGSFLLATVLLANLAQTASLVLKPFSVAAFRRVNRRIANAWWGACVVLSRQAHGIDIVVTGDSLPPGENAIVVANHQQMTDIPFLLFLAHRHGRLGDLKWIVKDYVKYVPGVGWGMAFLDCVFVKRNWAADRQSIERTFAKLTRHRVPLWFISFPEGTRQTPAKLAVSRDFAARQGLPEPTHLLVPRTHGFVASVQGLRGHATAVYDVTIGYERGVPSLGQYVRGFAPRAHLHLRRYRLEELPTSDEELAAWLRTRFEEKDRLLDAFYARGAFDGAAPVRDAADGAPPRDSATSPIAGD